MKSMKTMELIKILETSGFKLLRSNGHLVYGNAVDRIAIPHHRIVSPGIMRQVSKVIKGVLK